MRAVAPIAAMLLPFIALSSTGVEGAQVIEQILK